MTISLTLTDGRIHHAAKGITARQAASSIAPSLGKAMLYAQYNNAAIDATAPLETDGTFKVITKKDKEEADIFLRHDVAHLLGQAVRELHKDAKFAIGPAIENGFYYDIDLKESLSQSDLPILEKRMHDIIKRKVPIQRHVWTRQQAIEYFHHTNEVYKLEIIENLDKNTIITIYEQGDFTDLCRGPHTQNTGYIPPYFALTKISGAYWRGNSKNPMLQRIYGVAFYTQEELSAYQTLQEEASKRDHRKLGREMNLFHMQEESPGNIFWHPDGWRLYGEIQRYMQQKQWQQGYQEVKTPQLLDSSFWQQSGHWDKYSVHMFIAKNKDEDKAYALKPMNCPCHVQIFKQGTRSYKDLPLRLAEFGSCHRYEPSGALHGLMRVRAFTQDDAHIFCTKEQIEEETIKFCGFLHDVYRDFFGNSIQLSVKFSDRPENRIGDDSQWDEAENALKDAATKAKLSMIENKGEGAFYGPKLEFVLKDSIGRDWQLGTLQVDFNLGSRLGATYMGSDGTKQTPVLLHRAILGSFERFIGILLEHYAGKLPLWLAPVQVAITTVVNSVDDYAQDIKKLMENKGFRVLLDTRNEKIPYKIREHSMQKIPIIAIIGEKEKDEQTLTLRFLGAETQKIMPHNEAIKKIEEDIQSKRISLHDI